MKSIFIFPKNRYWWRSCWTYFKGKKIMERNIIKST